MKSWLRVVLFMGVCLFSLKAQAEYDLSKYFPLDQGDVWVYETVYSGTKVGTFEATVSIDGVEAISGQETVKKITKLEKPGYMKTSLDYLAMDSEGIKLYQIDARRVDPFELIFPAQIEIGRTVESSFSLEADADEGAGSANISKKIILEGVEDITVKAGEFKDCLKFSIWSLGALAGESSIENSQIWLALNIGIIKETVSMKFVEKDGSSSERLAKKELKSAVVGGMKVGEEVKQPAAVEE